MDIHDFMGYAVNTEGQTALFDKTISVELTYDELCNVIAAMKTCADILRSTPAGLSLMEILGARDSYNSAGVKLTEAYNAFIKK